MTDSVAQLLQQALRRLDACEAETVAGREGVVQEHSVCSELGLVAVMLDGLRWAFMPSPFKVFKKRSDRLWGHM